MALRRDSQPSGEVVAQVVDGAEAGAPGDGDDRVVGGLQVVLGEQDALSCQPLQRTMMAGISA